MEEEKGESSRDSKDSVTLDRTSQRTTGPDPTSAPNDQVAPTSAPNDQVVPTSAPNDQVAPGSTIPFGISHDSLVLEEEGEEDVPNKPELIAVCSCLLGPTVKPELPPRKEYLLTIASRTDEYLRSRRIPELIRFLLTKLLASCSDKPLNFMDKLLDDCMLFRAGLGIAPVLYERRHLEAVVKSFDPLNRGWLSPGQVRRAFITLGFPTFRPLEERTPTAVVVTELEEVQEKELYKLITSGTNLGFKSDSLLMSSTDLMK